MKEINRLLILFLVSSIWSSATAQYDSQNRQLDNMIEQGIKDWKIPAMSVLVMKDGMTTFKKTYGVRNIETKERANNETLFTMASTTKAIVAMAMAILVDEGKVHWDDPVKKHYPHFELSDSYIRGDARIKDLFTHNLGIGNADLIWYGNDLSTEESLGKFALAEKVYPLRGGYQYQNMGYAIAGEVIEAISGIHWADFVTERIFRPLGMSWSFTKSQDILPAGNVSTPHFDDPDDGVVPLDYIFFDQVGAAGIIWSCIDDMEKYFRFITNKGVVSGDTLIKAQTFEYLFQPKIIIDGGFYPTEKLTKPHWKTYGMGWFQHDYKGAKVDFHTGSIDGLIAINGWLRDENLGVYVFSNLDHAELRHAIMYKVFDLYALGGERDWHKEVFDLYNGFREESKSGLRKIEESRVLNTKPSHGLEAYQGTFTHEMYGTVVIELIDGQLHAYMNNKWHLSLNHWHYDTFRSDKHHQWRSKVFASFGVNQEGKISDLEIMGREFRRMD